MATEDQVREEAVAEEKRRRRRRNRLIVLLVVATIVTLLGVANFEDVELDYLVGDSQVSLVWVILGSFAGGAISGRAYSFVRGRRDD